MRSDSAGAGLPDALKLVVAGGFGVGKTTLVSAVSEIPPVNTEARMTVSSVGVDDLALTGNKATTTVAFDFGRITLASEVVLFLFGLPGQERFGAVWQQMCVGAAGAVVLVDTRRLEDSFGALSSFEAAGVPMVVAVNQFDGAGRYPQSDIREALRLPGYVPVLDCDARARSSVKTVLITLVEHLLTRYLSGAATVPGPTFQDLR